MDQKRFDVIAVVIEVQVNVLTDAIQARVCRVE
jgi:hypothetical protein